MQTTKNTSELQKQFVCAHKYGKECKFYMKWCTVIVTINFLLDFVVPVNLDITLLKLCESILSSAHFYGWTKVWFYELHYREKKSQQYVVLYTEMCCTQVFYIVYILLEPVARN